MTLKEVLAFIITIRHSTIVTLGAIVQFLFCIIHIILIVSKSPILNLMLAKRFSECVTFFFFQCKMQLSYKNGDT